jgi:hypothetical protein
MRHKALVRIVFGRNAFSDHLSAAPGAAMVASFADANRIIEMIETVGTP